MADRSALARRSFADWSVRVALALALTVTGYSATTRAWAYAMRKKQPERAQMLAPHDARVIAAMSENLSGREATPADRKRADILARAALRRDPLALPAVGTLGLNALYRGDAAAAKRWFEYAQRLSRRDLRTQLWAIEYAVGKDDVSGAVRHYDIALRTSTSAADLLFPVLRSAIADATIRAALLRTLAARPSWSERFISEAASADGDVEATALLFQDLARAGVKVPDRAQVLVIARLVAANKLVAAWNYYAVIRPESDRRASRDPNFTADIVEPTAFDWQSSYDSGITVSVQRGLVDFAAPPAIGGLLLRQLQLLPPGVYILDGRAAGIDQNGKARLYWMLTCIGGRELGRIQMPDSAEANGRFAGQFAVPADCPAQYLSLNARASDEKNELTGQIERASLRPAP